MKWFWLITLWFRETFTGLVRNFWGNVTAVLLTIACLSLFSVSYIAGLNAEHFAKVLDSKIEIKIDVKESITDYENVAKQLIDIGNINEIKFVSKEEAFDIMEKEMEENAEVLYAIGENPFPARYVIKVKDPNKIDDVVKEIKALHIADDVQYGKEYVDKLVSFTKGMQKVGYVITFISALFTIYIVTNVIKYNIDKRKDELRIKRLTGAGMITIRLPFVLEALVITAISGTLVYQIFAWGYEKAESMVKEMVSYAPILSKTVVLDELFLPLMVIALAIGLVGSFISTQKFIAKY